MKQGSHVCLYKKKGNPIIQAYVVDDMAKIALPLDEFRKLLVQEIGSVTWVMRDATFAQRVDTAFETIIRGIKEGATVIL